ncbi:excisionase family DNA-binding protein [Corynebacterium meridianum]|uniref:Excisionase family DNA-binding protein n=1 Tax=Corynebacterium meridianum TaxID=2765363 RepID=A0A934M3Z6_9CORY|nr:excisionase family DNA-binding protein [Corynebacterium meridianum]
MGSPAVHNKSDLYITLREAADRGYAGYSTLRKYVAEGRLPTYRAGRRVRLRLTDLEALLTSTDSNAIDVVIDNLVTAAPPLTTEQTHRLRDLLGGA